ncbi:MAG TPA: hypothetical protein VFB63_07105, partial [Bryobacteraceae bacterium]|nr:hypothetical protein [Bryobacteraceae bacterium]
MQTLIGISLVPFSITLLLTPLVRNAFIRYNLVDEPDGARKLHQRAVPRIGGIPIAIAYVTPYVLLALVSESHSNLFATMPLIVPLILSAGVVFLTGLLDDVIGLAPWEKLAGQLIANVGA